MGFWMVFQALHFAYITLSLLVILLARSPRGILLACIKPRFSLLRYVPHLARPKVVS